MGQGYLCFKKAFQVILIVFALKNIFYYLIIERERKEGRERETINKFINLLFRLFMHSLVVPCMCSDQELNTCPGILEQRSNQLSYLARAESSLLESHFYSPTLSFL